MQNSLTRRFAAEFTGTAFLLSTVVGSGIMAERMASGNAAVALLGNTLATAAMLFVLILSFARISGAHFNPIVTLTELIERKMSFASAAAYLLSQLSGAVVGVVLANVMFELPPILLSQKTRTGPSQWLSEAIATFGLMLTIRAAVKVKSNFAVPLSVAAYIAAAYWFTASTSFANPAVTIARSLSDTFAGIRMVDVPMFIAAQFVGCAAALVLGRWLFDGKENE